MPMLGATAKPGCGIWRSEFTGATSEMPRCRARHGQDRSYDSRLPISHSRAPQQRRAQGFSLIEMIAVLVLIALVFAMVSMSFSKSLSSAKIQAASRDLVAALRFTRGQAIVRGKSTSLELDVENNRYMVPGRHVVNLPPNMRMSLLTADNEVTGQNSGRIRFFPDGASTGGHISVFFGNDEWRINVDWLTGAVTRQELKR
jgi:general secretion pathway protein H